ncbi:MAG: hypothetical protein HFE39_05485 [Clostridiales bacterium]|nr:hypothetical protein [Clostridiales bacterium]
MEFIICGIGLVVLFLPSLLSWFKNRRLVQKILLYNVILVFGVLILEGILLRYGYGIFCSVLTVLIGITAICGWTYLSFKALNV